MLQPDESPFALHVDDDVEILDMFGDLTRGMGIPYKPLHYTPETGMEHVMDSIEQSAGRIRLLLVDGDLKSGMSGMDIVNSLHADGLIASREDILNQGGVERGKLAAVLVSGGVPDIHPVVNMVRTGVLTGVIGKPCRMKDLHPVMDGLLQDQVPPSAVERLLYLTGRFLNWH